MKSAHSGMTTTERERYLARAAPTLEGLVTLADDYAHDAPAVARMASDDRSTFSPSFAATYAELAATAARLAGRLEPMACCDRCGLLLPVEMLNGIDGETGKPTQEVSHWDSLRCDLCDRICRRQERRWRRTETGVRECSIGDAEGWQYIALVPFRLAPTEDDVPRFAGGPAHDGGPGQPFSHAPIIRRRSYGWTVMQMGGLDI